MICLFCHRFIRSDDTVKVKAPPKVIDTGGGFLLEEDPDDDKDSDKTKVVHPPGRIVNVFYFQLESFQFY